MNGPCRYGRHVHNANYLAVVTASASLERDLVLLSRCSGSGEEGTGEGPAGAGLVLQEQGENGTEIRMKIRIT